ncbi:hypothetical protein H9Q72_010135 [Fusarium xylarioides]|uniref:Uncharacterized protein n=1 Tax=Fusarium xylarioides TaxID=221167 RepID=A0A9P7IUD4_9HYPO|nr:hypothetical protein H9Q70_000138 [Fusarium xylarioides]KAG5761766.1 hypothetical protein H9Q72_010135 [Fusarium xylarioides]KAG5786220.1 hypothetical protein H9Q73_000160 [Fusarium xylarioides]KAG5810597.1 hypothetical protein H9Q71_005382 [Fusarium xylarioides]KAG5824179.1 hypothetical protein H9Q74_005736 [Fusarium xylarioides]
MTGTKDDLHRQWSVPADILSLLLLIGGDIVQKAIAQLVGYTVSLPGRRQVRLQITPVAFSFGWAAYSFVNLLAAVGDMRLMPKGDHPALTVNCANGFARETRSWVLSRLLRDHEIRSRPNKESTTEEARHQSIRIDIFYLGPASPPSSDPVWWSGWGTFLLQIGIALIPCALQGDWGPILITLCGAILVALTCAMPQWSEEKWGTRILTRQKVVCVTQGNGSSHILVFIGFPGAFDLESLSTYGTVPRSETRWISLMLAILWTCLLITISGIKQHTWYLVAIGGLGMLQNVYAAGAVRGPAALGFQLKRFPQAPTIIGYTGKYHDVSDDDVDFARYDAELAELERWAAGMPDASHPNETMPHMPKWLRTMSKEDEVPSWLASPPSQQRQKHVNHHNDSRLKWLSVGGSESIAVREGVGVHGALMELEKWVPSAGLAMSQLFFPGGLKYNEEAIRDNVHRRFWKAAYHTVLTRRKASEKFRAEQNITEV